MVSWKQWDLRCHICSWKSEKKCHFWTTEWIWEKCHFLNHRVNKFGYLASITGIWPQITVIWPQLRVFGLINVSNSGIWPQIRVFGLKLVTFTGIWPHFRVFDLICGYLTSFAGIWPHFGVISGIWPHFGVISGIWPHLLVFGLIYWSLASFTGLWPHFHGHWPHFHGHWPPPTTPLATQLTSPAKSTCTVATLCLAILYFGHCQYG